jgi:hypothetical protein
VWPLSDPTFRRNVSHLSSGWKAHREEIVCLLLPFLCSVLKLLVTVNVDPSSLMMEMIRS